MPDLGSPRLKAVSPSELLEEGRRRESSSAGSFAPCCFSFSTTLVSCIWSYLDRCRLEAAVGAETPEARWDCGALAVGALEASENRRRR